MQHLPYLIRNIALLVPIILLLILLVTTALDKPGKRWNKSFREIGIFIPLLHILVGLIITASLQGGERPPDIWVFWALLSTPLYFLSALLFVIGYAGRMREIRNNNSQPEHGADTV